MKGKNNINESEIRCITSELRIENRSNSTQSRTIVGYAAKFDCWSEPIMGWFKEKIAYGAFEECDMSDVIMCFNHNDNAILARTSSSTLRLSIDDIGLRFEFDAPETSLGNDMLELVRRGDITKCSFRFLVKQDEWEYANEKNSLEMDERTILKFTRIIDVSLVVFPAYKDTEASVRHFVALKEDMLKTLRQEHDKTASISSRQRYVEMLRCKQKKGY